MTYDEDNRFLANPALRTEPLDVLKYIPLSATDTNSYLSFGAFIRERVEYFSNPDWGSGPPGSAYLMQRYLIHADLHLGERVRVFTELGSSLEDWRPPFRFGQGQVGLASGVRRYRIVAGGQEQPHVARGPPGNGIRFRDANIHSGWTQHSSHLRWFSPYVAGERM